MQLAGDHFTFLGRSPSVTRRLPENGGGAEKKPMNIRFGSKADIRTAKGHVRFTPKSGHVRCTSLRLLWANSGHQRLGSNQKKNC
jgi:hypothetical protein